MNERERRLLDAYAVAWPRSVERERSGDDIVISFALEGFAPFAVRLLMGAAPVINKALLGRLPLEGHLIHSAWSGSGVRCLEKVELPGVSAHENAGYAAVPGDFCYTVGHDELTMFYGECRPSMASGPVRESIFGVLEGRLPEFQRACVLTRLTGARPFVLARG